MIIRDSDAPTYVQGPTTARGYAAPSRGSREISLWQVDLAAGERSPVHTLSREEVFLLTDGGGSADLDGERTSIGAGDCLVVSPGIKFALEAGPQGLRAICAMGAGGYATLVATGEVVVPPWAE